MSGLMSTVGSPDRPPVRIGASVVDCATGMTAAFSVAASLLQRARAGGGERLEVAPFDVAVSWMGYRIADYSLTGELPGRSRRGGFAGMTPNGVFPAGDDGTLVERVVEAGVPAGPVNGVGDVVTDDHVATRDLLTESQNLAADESVETVGVPFVTHDGRPEMRGEPPEVGEHTRAVLAELGYSEERIDRMLAAGAAIE